MNNLQSIVLTLSISYAVIGALLLVVLVYARLPWPVKAVAVIVTSAFYVVSFIGDARTAGLGQPRQAARRLQAAADPHRRSAFAGRRSGLDLPVGRTARRRQSAERRSRAPIAFPTATSSPKRPTPPTTRSPPGVRRAGVPPISAAATATSSTPSENTSRRRSSWRPPAAIPRPANSRPGSRVRRMAASRRSFRHACRRRTNSIALRAVCPATFPQNGRGEASSRLGSRSPSTRNEDLALDMLRVVNSLIGILLHCWRKHDVQDDCDRGRFGTGTRPPRRRPRRRARAEPFA